MIQNFVGGTVITGAHIDVFQMMALRGALFLETNGMKVSRGRSAYAIVKACWGLKGLKVKVLEQFEKVIAEAKIQADASEQP